MTTRLTLWVLVISLCEAATAQIDTNLPHIGYLYPAGGQQGTTLYVTAGGQFLRGADKVYVSGEGVTATVVEVMRPATNLNADQRKLITERLKQVRNQRISELPTDVKAAMFTKEQLQKLLAETSDISNDKEAEKAPVKMPQDPLLYDLDNKSLRELAHIQKMIFMPRFKKQPNRQLAEAVLVKIEIDAKAEPGLRQVRIGTPANLTNPMLFEVGAATEIRELEPNDRKANEDLPELKNLPPEKNIELPAVLNGQIMPGDIDRFRFRAQTGQNLVIQVQARKLIPYLADAVPGWFQPTITVYNAAGTEIAFADDYRFDPDPVLYWQVPRDGEYELEIRDSIYRGREDFVYRIGMGQTPFITQLFPLGVRKANQTTASIDGWNLSENKLELKETDSGQPIHKAYLKSNGLVSNPVSFAVDSLTEYTESRSNNDIQTAEKVDLPIIVNGRIENPDDADIFKFEANAADSIVAEVSARCLNSPLDSLLRLTDASGTVIGWNDDYAVKDKEYLFKDAVGLITHPADSYLTAALPKAGTYYLHVTDSQNHGGPAYGYRLRISRPQPDFALRVTPAGLGMKAGTIAPITIHVLRKDGFTGDIEVTVKDPPSGFKIHGGVIPAGCERMRMTLQAPKDSSKELVALELEGRANINGNAVNHPVIAAEDMMQAFLYRHLVPAEAFMVEVRPNRRPPAPVELAGTSPVKLPQDGVVQVRLRTPKRPMLKEIDLTLYNPPAGITLQNVSIVPEGLAFELKAQADVVQANLRDNLIIEAFREFVPNQQDGKQAPKRRDFIGVIPAIPIQIVTPAAQKASDELASLK